MARTTTIPCLRCGRTGRCYVDHRSCYCYHPGDGTWGYPSKMGKDGGQLFWADPPGKPTAKPTSELASISRPIASDDELHKVYSRLLELCPLELNDVYHLEYERGITDLERYQFGRMPSSALRRAGIAHKLCSEFGQELLLRVPGFISHKGKIKINPGYGGLLIPSSGSISNVRLRLDNPTDGSRYRYLSGGCRGVKALPTAYAVMPEGEEKGCALGILTEGEFKAIACYQVFRCLSIGVPGVNFWQLGLEALAGIGTVVVAWDADHRTNPNVLRTLKQCIDELKKRSQNPFLPLWDSSHKGFDDVLLAGQPYELIQGDALTKYLNSTEVRNDGKK